VTEEELELGDERTTFGSTKKRDGTGPDSTTNPRRPREKRRANFFSSACL
jgi:hypothetical protein